MVKEQPMLKNAPRAAFPGPLLRRAKDALSRRLHGTAFHERVSGFRHSKTSFSQFGEDVHIAQLYDYLKNVHGIVPVNPVYVDIGAYRPIVWSNSHFFHRAGWHGINIEPTPGFKRVFDRLRPRDLNLEVGIAGKASTAVFHEFGRPSVWNTLDLGAAEYAAKATGKSPTLTRVELMRLDTILSQHLDGSFELLLIDAEGMDLEVLRSNDFGRYHPRFVLVEVMNVTTSNLSDHPVVRHMADHGYFVHSWLNPSLLFAPNDMRDRLP